MTPDTDVKTGATGDNFVAEESGLIISECASRKRTSDFPNISGMLKSTINDIVNTKNI